MKVRCPHCNQVFQTQTARNARECPECNKTVLLPRFFGDKNVADVNRAVLHREAILRRRASAGNALPGAGTLFMKRPMRMFFVIALLVFIGGMLLDKVRNPGEIGESARTELALDNLATLRIAVERFHGDCGRYPETHEGLAALILDPGVEGWSGPYILGLRPDPWKRSFQYRLENGQPVITSMGADGIAGTDYDIHAPPPPSHEFSANQGVYRVMPGE